MARREADPETLRLREKLEALEKKHAEAEAKARAVEERARKDATRTSLREALEAKGIKGARARAVIADFEQSGALRFDEETGEAQLVVAPRITSSRIPPLWRWLPSG